LCLVIRTLAVAISLATAVTLADAQSVRCSITKKHYCTSEGCKAVAPTVWINLDISRQRYSRCEANGCDQYDAHVTASGIFFVIDVPGTGTIAKVTMDGTHFLEIATLLDTAFVSFGTCQQ
jgi:hypothetical protein